MAGNAWGIKLGSAGLCVSFCERHRIVGLGWEAVDHTTLQEKNRDEIWHHIRAVYPREPNEGTTDRWVGSSTGQLYRFVRQCAEEDYVIYYDPAQKHVRICRVISPARYRDFDLQEDVDIWHYRQVEYPVDPIPILDFYGGLTGRLLGPRMSFWTFGDYDKVHQVASGLLPHIVAAPDAEIASAYGRLRDLIVKRAETLQAEDWEWLAVDYLKAQGAHVDERLVGGSRPIIDVEASFDHGELPRAMWRVQVKRYQDRPVDWPEIEHDLRRAGDFDQFLYVSVFGFTPEAQRRADTDDWNVVLFDSQNFTRFLLSGRVRDRLREKLKLPAFGQ